MHVRLKHLSCAPKQSTKSRTHAARQDSCSGVCRDAACPTRTAANATVNIVEIFMVAVVVVVVFVVVVKYQWSCLQFCLRNSFEIWNTLQIFYTILIQTSYFTHY